MLLVVLNLFLIVNISSALDTEINAKHLKSSDSVLCRFCGSDILTTDSIISKLSPASVHSFDDTVFNKDEILVQVLSKDFFLQFPLLTSIHTNCVGVGEWETDDNWFPGYHWKPCVCPGCGTFLGWMYEPIDRFSITSPEQFFGIVISQLIGESCKYSFF